VKLAVTDAIKPELIYKDHRIIVSSVGRGWRAMIYAPGSNTALRDSPASLAWRATPWMKDPVGWTNRRIEVVQKFMQEKTT